jgi:hypothetical protein
MGYLPRERQLPDPPACYGLGLAETPEAVAQTQAARTNSTGSKPKDISAIPCAIRRMASRKRKVSMNGNQGDDGCHDKLKCEPASSALNPAAGSSAIQVSA